MTKAAGDGSSASKAGSGGPSRDSASDGASNGGRADSGAGSHDTESPVSNQGGEPSGTMSEEAAAILAPTLGAKAKPKPRPKGKVSAKFEAMRRHKEALRAKMDAKGGSVTKAAEARRRARRASSISFKADDVGATLDWSPGAGAPAPTAGAAKPAVDAAPVVSAASEAVGGGTGAGDGAAATPAGEGPASTASVRAKSRWAKMRAVIADAAAEDRQAAASGDKADSASADGSEATATGDDSSPDRAKQKRGGRGSAKLMKLRAMFEQGGS